MKIIADGLMVTGEDKKFKKMDKTLVETLKGIFEVVPGASKEEPPVDVAEPVEDVPAEDAPAEEKPDVMEKPEEPLEKATPKGGKEKEFFGTKGNDEFFYLFTVYGEDGKVTSRSILDAEDKEIASDKTLEVPPDDIAAFLRAAMKATEVTTVSFSIIEKYILEPEVAEEQEEEQEAGVEKAAAEEGEPKKEEISKEEVVKSNAVV